MVSEKKVGKVNVELEQKDLVTIDIRGFTAVYAISIGTAINVALVRGFSKWKNKIIQRKNTFIAVKQRNFGKPLGMKIAFLCNKIHLQKALALLSQNTT